MACGRAIGGGNAGHGRPGISAAKNSDRTAAATSSNARTIKAVLRPFCPDKRNETVRSGRAEAAGTVAGV